MECVEHFLGLCAHLFEPIDRLHSLVYSFGVDSQLFLRCFEFQSAFLDEIVDLGDLVNVGRSIEAGPVVVAERLYDSELAFPEPEGRGGDRKHFRYLGDFVVFFSEIVHFAGEAAGAMLMNMI